MTSQVMYEQLDGMVDSMLRGDLRDVAHLDPAMNELVALASVLRSLPHPEFRERLRLEMRVAATALVEGRQTHQPKLVPIPGRMAKPDAGEQILPTLFGAGYGTYPVHRSNFLVSALLHAAMVAIVLGSSYWITSHNQQLKQNVISLIGAVSDYPLPFDKKRAGGGGGGGDRDALPASKGSTPRFSREQITPPAIVIRNEHPKLTAEPTVVGPPDIKLPQSATLGDPLARLLEPSNGTGSGGGIGTGSGGGVGSGTGAGVGPGHGGGIGGGIYRVGGGVSAPRVIYDPDPQYSDEARKAKYQGTVVLWIVVGPDGRARDVRVSRALGMGLDEKAVEAVRKWRFEPALKDGHPVAVQVNVEVNFRMY